MRLLRTILANLKLPRLQRLFVKQGSMDYWRRRDKLRQIAFWWAKHRHGLEERTKASVTWVRHLTAIAKGTLGKTIFALAVVGVAEGMEALLLRYGGVIGRLAFSPETVHRCRVFYDDLRPKAEANLEFVSAVAQTGATLIGLYLAAVSIIISTAYQREPADVRLLVLRDRVSTTFAETLILTTAVGFMLMFMMAVGHQPGLFATATLGLLILVSIVSIIPIGERSFNFLDVGALCLRLDGELRESIFAVTAEARWWDEPSFQAHYQGRAEHALDTYAALIEIAGREDKRRTGGLTDVLVRAVTLLTAYQAIKARIPSDSLWFRRRYRHASWLTADTTRTQVALRSGTTIQPELVPDLMWFEEKIAQLVIKGLNASPMQRDLPARTAICYALNSLFGVMGKCLAGSEFLLLYERLSSDGRKAANDASISTDGVEARDDHLRQCLELLDASTVGLLDFVLGLSKVLTSVSAETLGGSLFKVNWRVATSLYRIGLPVPVLRSCEDLRKKIELEIAVEGNVVSPACYVRELAIAGLLREVGKQLDGLVTQLEKTFDTGVMGAKRPVATAQLVQRGLEGCEKFTRHFGSIRPVCDGLSACRKATEFPWPVLQWNEWKDRVKKLRQRLLTALANGSTLLAAVKWPDSWPDYAGYAYCVLAEECYRLMWEGDDAGFGALFPAYFMNALASHERLIEDLSNQELNTRITFAAEPVLDLLELSGFGLLYEELDSRPFYQRVKFAWDAFLKDKPNAKKIVEQLIFMDRYRSVRPSLTPRDIKRTEWGQSFGRRAREAGIISHSTGWFGGDVVNHKSRILRVVLATGDLCLYHVRDLFVARYLALRPEALGLELSPGAKELKDALARSEKEGNDTGIEAGEDHGSG